MKKVRVSSGIRMDLAHRSPDYIRELVHHHVGGQLKVAPEHTDPYVLDKMRKPANDDFERFTEVFHEESAAAGKRQQIIPYFIASHPGSDLDAMIHLAVFLKQNGYEVWTDMRPLSVRKALEQAGRQDLIGEDCDSLIPAKPPREALQRRRKEANQRFRGDYVHTIKGEKGKTKSGPQSKKKQRRHKSKKGYRPQRKDAQ